MGIRIRKKMGYSLSLKEIQEKVCYPNLNLITDDDDFMENDDVWDQFCDEIRATFDAIVDSPFALERCMGFTEFMNDRKKRHFYRYITYNRESGDADTILFQPIPAPKDWSRYNDSIDYVEAHIDPTNMSPKVIRHNRPLYPFVNLMRKNPDSYLGIEKYWEPFYLDHPEYKNAVPHCTYSVMLMLKYTNLVPEDKLADTIMLFRPTIYSYWT